MAAYILHDQLYTKLFNITLNLINLQAQVLQIWSQLWKDEERLTFLRPLYRQIKSVLKSTELQTVDKVVESLKQRKCIEKNTVAQRTRKRRITLVAQDADDDAEEMSKQLVHQTKQRADWKRQFQEESTEDVGVSEEQDKSSEADSTVVEETGAGTGSQDASEKDELVMSDDANDSADIDPASLGYIIPYTGPSEAVDTQASTQPAQASQELSYEDKLIQALIQASNHRQDIQWFEPRKTKIDGRSHVWNPQQTSKARSHPEGWSRTVTEGEDGDPPTVTWSVRSTLKRNDNRFNHSFDNMDHVKHAGYIRPDTLTWIDPTYTTLKWQEIVAGGKKQVIIGSTGFKINLDQYLGLPSKNPMYKGFVKEISNSIKNNLPKDFPESMLQGEDEDPFVPITFPKSKLGLHAHQYTKSNQVTDKWGHLDGLLRYVLSVSIYLRDTDSMWADKTPLDTKKIMEQRADELPGKEIVELQKSDGEPDKWVINRSYLDKVHKDLKKMMDNSSKIYDKEKNTVCMYNNYYIYILIIRTIKLYIYTYILLG